ncbi:cell wall metabolism sensor histidine kinase WalK [Massilibacterium senegalense]|uniref:cell wall metabolism sensor histidine kinase WalK n=1 Tax=Massilibacterium senegalense TaxID=1632858 RepID=UPI000780926C|nr:cell wall metabolism sensor histidine kinase WalK [Massilibacterium senegalense]
MKKFFQFFKSIRLKFILIYVLLILIALQVISVYFVRQLEDQFLSNFTNSLRERVSLLSYNVEQELNKPRDEQDISKLLSRNDILSSTNDIIEVQVIDKNKVVIGTSNPDTRTLIGQRSTEGRVILALLGTSYEKVLRDPKTNQRIKVIAEPIKTESGEIVGAIFLKASMEDLYNQMHKINRILSYGTILAIVITMGLGILLSQTITKPLSDMRRQAQVMSKGDFTRKVKVYGDDEIGQLASAFNELTMKLQEANATTEGERRKLSSVLTHMTDGVIATDRHGNVILLNDRAEEMLNVSRETILGEPIMDVLGLEYELDWEQLYDHSESVLLDFSDSEEEFIIRANFSVIQKENGPINGLIAVLHDVTEQEQIERDRREFVVSVSHELRTPLTTLRSYLEALADGAWKDETIAPEFLAVTQNETERMIRLVNDLLHLSKLDNKEIQLKVRRVDFIDYFHTIIDRFEISKKESIEFVRQLPKAKIFVSFDQDKLTQVLDNIISNAMKYSPEGGKVTFQLIKLGKHIRVSISDEGVGIPKESINRIFDRFYRVDKARSRQLGGTGLGLAISREIIHVHGGEIWATSIEGKGTTINFTLPFEPLHQYSEDRKQ